MTPLNKSALIIPAISVAGMLINCRDEAAAATTKQRPNILLVINDDQSYPYASAYGCKSVSTPGFDFVAEHGALFNNAYVTSPGSSPSRASLLTGLYPWQIEEAGTHGSSFPSKYKTYVDILEENGYCVGFTGKGWGPGNWEISGRTRNPAGPAFNDIKNDGPYSGLSKIDYASNFKEFLNSVPEDSPFCFWLGSNEPHRRYEKDSWKKAGHSLDEALIPSYLPDVDVVKGDIMDYAVEIEWADSHLQRALDELRHRGLLGNTLIIVLADNGMPFPHAKATCYADGLHVPMAICWLNELDGGVKVDENVSTIDLMPTILEAAGVQVEQELSGTSLIGIMTGVENSGHLLLSGRERHSSARPGNLGYPIRSIREGNWLLIHNFHPERWPAGNPTALKKDGTFGVVDGAYYDVDASPTSKYIIGHKTDLQGYFEAGMGFRPEYELFNLSKDPGCMNNLSGRPKYAKLLSKLKTMLHKQLLESGDTRLGDDPEIWETYPRLAGEIREFCP